MWDLTYVHKRCEMHGNSSMANCTSYRTPHIPGDGMLISRSYEIFVHLLWMVYDVPWAPTIHILGIDTTLNSPMGWYTIPQATKQWDHIHTDHTILQRWTSMDERKLAHFQSLHWMVCDVPWAPTIHTGVDAPVNPSMGEWVRLILHYTRNQARG